MVKYLIYFIVIILANSVGAVSGMGGGVIIKPVFDSLGFHSLSAITFYSSVAVLVMAVSSTTKQLKNGVTINWPEAMAMSVGSIGGGILGSQLFKKLLEFFGNQREVQLIQIILTIISLVLVLLHTLYIKHSYHLTNLGWFLGIGCLLGTFSTLLGIGGGPINVSLLIFCFGLTLKEATVYSIITILFSQLAKLGEIGLSSGYGEFDLSWLWAIIPAAIIGGYIGGLLSGKLSEKVVSKVFISVVIVVILINLWNGLNLI